MAEGERGDFEFIGAAWTDEPEGLQPLVDAILDAIADRACVKIWHLGDGILITKGGEDA